jgi:transcriptional regulator with XRE-family HTH domain
MLGGWQQTSPSALVERSATCAVSVDGGRSILAAHAELSKTHICELEVGKREVGLKTLERLAQALDMKISDLMKLIGR